MYIVCSEYHRWRCHQFKKMEKILEVLDTTLVLVIFQYKKYWRQILSVLIQNTNNSTFFTYTLGHVKKSGIVDALNLRHLKFDASKYLFFF